ncbi:type II secretion system minor pseudopilin GspI [uncultured Pseudacidovorax sp.]|uniref:type II secretion system minor pseudopilin GspI n=1 Tax=uncultured Pseudacidovorax sp. TaxID=679313 RepID=UPI0025EE64AE|nr:type II secretion system minor pseudopilin GspI [uncultured Pseudacidovorax sp.]
MSIGTAATRRFRGASAGHAATRLHAPAGHGGFTLVEVLVALAIVAIALAAGAQATNALTRNAQRQSDMVLAQLCAENQLIQLRLSPQMPPVGESSQGCEQAGVQLDVAVSTTPTLNPNFNRVDVQVRDAQRWPLLRLSTVIGRY